MRVPKTGSQALTLLVQHYLAYTNHFKTSQRIARPIEKLYLNAYEQEEYVMESSAHGENMAFNGMHENYIEYGSFGFPKPIFISLIRDPIEKEISWFYYIRSDLYDVSNRPILQNIIRQHGGEFQWRNKTFDDCVKYDDRECRYIPNNEALWQWYRRQSLQFCGNHKACWGFGTSIAIQMAKHNVERNFAVVGSWEDTNITLTVLEHYIPKYFKGALKLYYDNLDKIKNTNKNNQKPKTSDETLQILRRNFTGELDFYHFCKQRLYKQYLAVVDRSQLKF